MKFVEGDRVAWDHYLGAIHGQGSVLKAPALPAGTPIGTVIEPANEKGTWFVVQLDSEHIEHPAVQGASATHPDADKLVLTGDELVKISEE